MSSRFENDLHPQKVLSLIFVSIYKVREETNEWKISAQVGADQMKLFSSKE